MRFQSLPLAAALVLSLIGPATTARGQSVAPDVKAAIPEAVRTTMIINRPGSYSLSHNLRVGDITAIQITGSNVSLDLGGRSLIGPRGRRGVAIAISGAHNVRVHNGEIRNFKLGVMVADATNVVIEDLSIDGQDSGGAPPDIEIGIMLVETRGARVTHNVITNTFLGIFVRGEQSGGNRIAGNLITGGANGQLAICYNPAPGAPGGGPDGDLVFDNVISHFHRGMSFNADSAGNVVRENTVAYFDLGIVEAAVGSNMVDDNHEVQIAP